MRFSSPIQSPSEIRTPVRRSPRRPTYQIYNEEQSNEQLELTYQRSVANSGRNYCVSPPSQPSRASVNFDTDGAIAVVQATQDDRYMPLTQAPQYEDDTDNITEVPGTEAQGQGFELLMKAADFT